MNKILGNVINYIHYVILAINAIAVPAVIIHEPFYIWVPITTLLISPLLSPHCIVGKLVDHFKDKED